MKCFCFWTGKEPPSYLYPCLESLVVFGNLDVIFCYDGNATLKSFRTPVKITTLDELLSNEELEIYKSLSGNFIYVNRADYFRIVVLKKFGGFFCDTDVFALRSFPKLVEGVNSYIASEDGVHLSNGIVYAKQNHPAFVYMYDHFRKRYKPNTFNLVGPLWYTELQWMFDKCDFNPKTHYFISWRDWEQLYDPSDLTIDDLLSKGAYSIHLWGECARRNGFDVTQADKTSLFRKLMKYLQESQQQESTSSESSSSKERMSK